MTELFKDISQEQNILIQVKIMIIVSPHVLQPIELHTLCANSYFSEEMSSPVRSFRKASLGGKQVSSKTSKFLMCE